MVNWGLSGRRLYDDCSGRGFTCADMLFAETEGRRQGGGNESFATVGSEVRYMVLTNRDPLWL